MLYQCSADFTCGSVAAWMPFTFHQRPCMCKVNHTSLHYSHLCLWLDDWTLNGILLSLHHTVWFVDGCVLMRHHRWPRPDLQKDCAHGDVTGQRLICFTVSTLRERFTLCPNTGPPEQSTGPVAAHRGVSVFFVSVRAACLLLTPNNWSCLFVLQ